MRIRRKDLRRIIESVMLSEALDEMTPQGVRDTLVDRIDNDGGSLLANGLKFMGIPMGAEDGLTALATGFDGQKGLLFIPESQILLKAAEQIADPTNGFAEALVSSEETIDQAASGDLTVEEMQEKFNENYAEIAPGADRMYSSLEDVIMKGGFGDGRQTAMTGAQPVKVSDIFNLQGGSAGVKKLRSGERVDLRRYVGQAIFEPAMRGVSGLDAKDISDKSYKQKMDLMKAGLLDQLGDCRAFFITLE